MSHKMPPQKPGHSHQSYATPACVIDAVQRFLGIHEFVMDFAADANNRKAFAYWDEAANALSKTPAQWAAECEGGWGWCNPPYANIGPWAKQCLDSKARIAFLVPASVGSNWYRDYIDGQEGVTVLFMNGRIPFMSDHPTWLYPKDCVLALFGGEGEFQCGVWTWR